MTAAAPTFSIAIETANLDVADVDDLRACLASLEAQSPSPADACEVVLVNDGRVDETVVAELHARYPWLEIRLDDAADYVSMKVDAAATMTGEVVVLCDSDVRYDDGWLAAMLEPFRDSEIDAVAGETSTPITGSYSLAVALTFVFPRFTREATVQSANVYWANNVAFRRPSLLALPPTGDLPLYRGQTIVHSASFESAGVRIVRNPRARGHHLVIAPRDLALRYYRLGRDAALVRRLARTPEGARYDGAFPPDRGADSPPRKLVRRAQQAIAERRSNALLLPLALPVVVVAGVCWCAGWMTARHGASRRPGVFVSGVE